MKKFISILAGLLLLVSPFQGNAQQFKKATLINYLTGTKIVVETKEEADRGFRLGYHLYDSKLLGYNVITNYQTTLSASISSSQTTIPVSTVETKDGHVLTMDDLGNFAYLSVETGSKREEIVKCTGISGSSFTGCTRGLAFYGTSTEAVVANQYAHSAGSKVVMSNVHYVYQGFVDKQSDETIDGKKTFTELTTFNELPVSTTTAPTSDSQLTNKKYVDNLVISGGVPGSETTPGLFMLADKTQIENSTATSSYGGFDYNLLVGSNNVATSSQATTTLVATNASGIIDSSFINSSSLANATIFGGDGSDGILSISTGTTTIDLEGSDYVVKNYESISITGDATLTFSNPNPSGTIIVLKSKGDVIITSSAAKAINADGMGAATSTTAYGVILNNAASNIGGNGVYASVNSSAVGGAGGAEKVRTSYYSFNIAGKIIKVIPGGSGGNGGNGGQQAANPLPIGGDGGNGGGALIIECGGDLIGDGTISANGANGSNGVQGSAPNPGIAGGAGGGGGGAGGHIVILYNGNSTQTYTLEVDGGNGGNGSNGYYGGGSSRFAGGGGGGAGGINIGNGGAGGNGGKYNDPGQTGSAGTGIYGDGGTAGTGGTSASSVAGGGGGGAGGAGGAYFVFKNTEF